MRQNLKGQIKPKEKFHLLLIIWTMSYQPIPEYRYPKNENKLIFNLPFSAKEKKNQQIPTFRLASAYRMLIAKKKPPCGRLSL